MIVVDAMNLGYLLLSHPSFSEDVREMARVDDEWCAPPLWRSELRTSGYARAADRPDLLDEAKSALEQIWAWAYDWSEVGRPVHEGQPESQQLAVPMILLNLIDVVAGRPTSDQS